MDFYRRVEIVCRMIPQGRVATYGQLALLCGKPRNARQAGRALNQSCGSQVPAHRVVNSRGELSGAPAFDYPDLQRMLLEEEGVRVSGDNRVDLKAYGWKNTLEDALHLRELFEQEGI